MAQLQVVIVTPEATALDKHVDSVVLPLFDGEKGILANHAPMIGRLGKGKLRIKDGGSEESYEVDGGFVQIESNVVSILTGKSEAVASD
jgi:F-type H+-transporting ATPase subunit epsilon